MWSELDVDSSGNLLEFTNEYQRVFSKQPYGRVTFFNSNVFRNFES